MKIKLTENKEVFDFCEPYIIAELGSNHNGDMELAKKMILKAKESGADCVKFQSWSAETIFSKKVYEENYFLKDDYRERSDFNLKEIVEEFSISEDELKDMKKYCDEVDIDLISTPFSKKEVDFLVNELNAPFIKIASMDVNNYPFIKYIAQKNKPIVISTGLSELDEIQKAIKTIEEVGNNQIVILHCVSVYPPKNEDVHLNKIDGFRKIFSYPIGYSDHSIGTAIPIASVAKGVCIIEKHFTLDKEMFGWDHKVSATPEELKEISEGSKKVYESMGKEEIFSVEPQERKDAFRRSIVVTRNIKKGEVFKEDDLDFKRPGTGVKPEMFESIIGKECKREISEDELLQESDF